MISGSNEWRFFIFPQLVKRDLSRGCLGGTTIYYLTPEVVCVFLVLVVGGRRMFRELQLVPLVSLLLQYSLSSRT